MSKFNFNYDPIRQGFDTNTWRAISGSPAIGDRSRLFLDEELNLIGSTIHYTDITKGTIIFNVNIPSSPAEGDSRYFGVSSPNNSEYIRFVISDTLKCETSNGRETDISDELDWNGTDWNGEDLEFKIIWESVLVRFYINDVNVYTTPGGSTPYGPLNLYLYDDSTSAMSFGGISVIGAQSMYVNPISSTIRALVYLPLITELSSEIKNVSPMFTRSTTGTVIDFEGAMHTCKINEARFSGARRVENLIDNSENFDTSYGLYANTRCTIDSENNEAPDGSLTASLCVQIAGDTSAGICNNNNIGTNKEQGNIRVSVHLKKGYSSWGALYTSGGDKTWFDVEKGVVGIITGGQTDATITDVGNGWYRCSVTVATSLVDRCGVYLAEGNHGTTVIAGTSSLYIWGYQIEKLSGTQTEASEYVSTGVSVATGETVLDDDFSTDTTGDYSQIETTLSYEDSSFMRATYTTTNANKGFNRTLITTGKYYKIKFKAKGTRASVFGSIGNNVDLASQLVIKNPTLTASWQEYEFTIKATQEQCRFYLANTGSIGDVLDIDDISVKEEYFHGANVDGVKYFKTKRDGSVIEESVLKGYLNEPAGTNLCTYSEDFGNADWTKQEVACVTNQIVAPNGTLTADKIEIDSSASGREQVYQTTTVVSGNKYTATVYVKNNDIGYCWLSLFFPDSGTRKNMFLNFDTGLLTAGSDGSPESSSVEDVSNGWYKISISQTSDHTTVLMEIGLSEDGSSYSGGTDGKSLYTWGAQLEASNFKTSYVKTEATSVTRTADSLTVDNTSRKVLPNSFCLAGTWSPLGAGADYATADVRLFGSQDSRDINYKQRTALGGYNYVIAVGGGYFQLAENDLTQSTENKYAFSLFQDGSDVNAKIYKDGVQKLSETVTQTLDHSNESLEIGSWAGSVFASNIKDIKIWNKELNKNELKRITE